jgi:hypothetical protein
MLIKLIFSKFIKLNSVLTKNKAVSLRFKMTFISFPVFGNYQFTGTEHKIFIELIHFLRVGGSAVRKIGSSLTATGSSKTSLMILWL